MPRIAFLILLAACLTACQSPTADVVSPDGRTVFVLARGPDQAPGYLVALDSDIVIDWSRLGLKTAGSDALATGLKLRGTEFSSENTTWEQPWGERRYVADHYNEMLARFESDNGARINLRVRVYNDGVGFRYEVPEQPAFAEVEITDELTEFRLRPDAMAFWQPGSDPFKYEVLYRETPVSEIDSAHTPATFRLESGVHVSLHEAALVDYSAYTLEMSRPGVLKARLRPGSDGVAVRTSAPFKTPWRTIQIADDAKGLIDSDLILNLNEPNKLGDVSWVEPGKYVGIWWAIHLDQQTWHQGPRHGATTAEVKRYIDFAAKYGFDGVLAEGWNVGWGEGEEYSFLEATPDLDLEAVAAYAEQKGVRLIGHHETFADIPAYEAVMGEAFDLYESLGVRQVKTGYVGMAGSLKPDNDWHDSQYAVEHQLRVLEEAAKRKISINTHEPVKDTGLRRTYPNWLTREGARGQEFAVWGDEPNPPGHTVMLPFTRMLAGPLDFTPGLFNLAFEARGSDRRVKTTLAKQLALYVVLYSPIHMAPDLIENYERHADAFQFIVDVPTDWEESIAIAGAIGDYVTIARKVRGGDDWFVGASTDEAPRTSNVPLDFLDADREYVATIYRDGDNADWESNPHEYAIEERIVDADDMLELRLAAGGGAAIRISPAPEEKQ
jgi:alpha-glucosidase